MSVQQDLLSFASPSKAKASQWFFKTGIGQYGEGDMFIGVTLPEQRSVAKKYKDLPLSDIGVLLASPIHEYRLTGLIILVEAAKKADEKKKKSIYDFYLSHTEKINNWDLVDCTASHIVGEYLVDKPEKRSVLRKLAASKCLWERRISIISTFAFIAKDDFQESFALSEILLHDPHDLIHKAVGWVLREIGKLDQEAEEKFLQKHYKTMPRTMLRYAIERFPQAKRAYYMG